MMALYRKVDVRMWGDRRFRGFSKPHPNGQSLWLYLLTGPHTQSTPGLSMAGEMGMAEALGWPIKAFREAFAEVLKQKMAKADWKARVIFVPKAIRYNPPESPNVVVSWAKNFDLIPECDLKAEWARSAYRYLTTEKADSPVFAEAFIKAFGEAFKEASARPIANQEQEQEQEQEQTIVGQTARPDGRWIKAIEYLNRRTGKKYSTSATVSHRKLIENLLKAGNTLNQIQSVIDDRTEKWGQDPRMADFLRPSTLFRKSNFENYLGGVGVGALVGSIRNATDDIREAQFRYWEYGEDEALAWALQSRFSETVVKSLKSYIKDQQREPV